MAAAGTSVAAAGTSAVSSEHQDISLVAPVESRASTECQETKAGTSVAAAGTSAVSSEHQDMSLVAPVESRASTECQETWSMEPELPLPEVDQWTLSSVGQTLIASWEVVRLDEARQSIRKSVTVN